jgi:hypothetical protein
MSGVSEAKPFVLTSSSHRPHIVPHIVLHIVPRIVPHIVPHWCRLEFMSSSSFFSRQAADRGSTYSIGAQEPKCPSGRELAILMRVFTDFELSDTLRHALARP